MSNRLSPEEGGYVLCRVEGCPRTTEDGQDQRCGLARLGYADESPLCGSDLTVDAWIDAGLLDMAPHVSHDTHHEVHKDGLTDGIVLGESTASPE